MSGSQEIMSNCVAVRVCVLQDTKDGKIELDADAADKIKITREDFLLALENDIKPAFGHSEETLKEAIPNGIIMWGHSVDRVLNDGRLMIQQTKTSELTPIVSILIEGWSALIPCWFSQDDSAVFALFSDVYVDYDIVYLCLMSATTDWLSSLRNSVSRILILFASARLTIFPLSVS